MRKFMTLAVCAASMMMICNCDPKKDTGVYNDEAYDIDDTIEYEDLIKYEAVIDDDEAIEIDENDEYIGIDIDNDLDAPKPKNEEPKGRPADKNNSRPADKADNRQPEKTQPAPSPNNSEYNSLISQLESSVNNLDQLCRRAQNGDSQASVKSVVEYDNIRSLISRIRRGSLTPDQQARVKDLETRANSIYY